MSIKPATYSVSRYIMPYREQAPGKRPHSLKESICDHAPALFFIIQFTILSIVYV